MNVNRDAFTHEEQLLILESIARVEEAVKRIERRATLVEGTTLND